MENVWGLAALWVGLALVATLVAIWFKISTALSEIVVGTVAQLIIGASSCRADWGRRPAGSVFWRVPELSFSHFWRVRNWTL
jgi:hypothetical protein